ncbi:hypothetical protein V498_08575 [Pseudogymnoascus sp. VKM F-4517 (FW-2822)]|nr:hypothetical protein V498_08575 [Pseudogymnoascus sp. VKM F-4517 (FW-2822)]
MFFSKAACLALAALLSTHGLAAPTVSDVAEISNTVNLDISLAGISDNDEAAYRSTNPAAAVFTRDGGDICGQSSFYKTTSSNSPILADCDQLKDRVRRLPFSDQWELPNGFTTLFWHGTCAFGLRNDGASKKVVIRRWDISDDISDSIKLGFVSSSRIAAKGRMICNGKKVI